MDRDARTWHARVARMRVPLGGSTMSVQRERTLILTVLLILTAASWALLIWQSRTANTMGMGLTMGMGAALFLAIWVVMMIAMMFPAAAPMILVFAQVQRDRRRGGCRSLAPRVFPVSRPSSSSPLSLVLLPYPRSPPRTSPPYP